ncbi:MAG: exosome complex RNA-binding protein Csl4 [Candidatus Diapherotrites archaeon]|nr:exosome complex RNA-binding protein Csl4 [Candidatus Diapherotrites archaeon]
MERKKELLYPGDFIADNEMFLAGEGTFEDGGEVRSAVVGASDMDMSSREARMRSSVVMPEFQREGQVVVGMIEESNNKVAFVKLFPITDGKTRFVPRNVSTVLRVNAIRRGFVKSLKDEYGTGDFIRAKIIESSPYTVALSTDGRNLGLVKAFCPECRRALSAESDLLVCESCGWKGKRKLVDDYGSVRV